MTILERARSIVWRLADDAGLLSADVTVLGRPLTPEEAIGEPGRRDFPIIVGKERILEARVLDARGHAFTDSAREIAGPLGEVLDLPLDSNQNRAICVAAMNAVMRHLGEVSATVHCKDDEPEECGAEIAGAIRAEHGGITVGLIGYNPAIAEALVNELGADRVRLTDLYAGNVGETRFGVEVWDGRTRTNELLEICDRVLVTGTTLTNGTFDAIFERGRHSVMVFGVTGAAVCQVMGIPRVCARGH